MWFTMGVMIERFTESPRVFISVIWIKIVYSSLSSNASLPSPASFDSGLEKFLKWPACKPLYGSTPVLASLALPDLRV